MCHGFMTFLPGSNAAIFAGRVPKATVPRNPGCRAARSAAGAKAAISRNADFFHLSWE